jgi:hypothetical protein
VYKPTTSVFFPLSFTVSVLQTRNLHFILGLSVLFAVVSEVSHLLTVKDNFQRRVTNERSHKAAQTKEDFLMKNATVGIKNTVLPVPV